MTRLDAPDSAIRFWAAMGFVALRSDDPWIVSALPKAAQDDSISVRITAANGLFNLGRHEAGRLAMIAIGGMIHGSFVTGTGVFGGAN